MQVDLASFNISEKSFRLRLDVAETDCRILNIAADESRTSRIKRRSKLGLMPVWGVSIMGSSMRHPVLGDDHKRLSDGWQTWIVRRHGLVVSMLTKTSLRNRWETDVREEADDDRHARAIFRAYVRQVRHEAGL